MIYLIDGEEEYLINRNINKIINDNKDSEISRFNGEDKNFRINDFLDIIDSVGLFANKSLVIIKDPYFLKRKVDENETKRLLKYCENPIYENDLVFYTLNDKFNNTLKIFKEISKNAQYIKCEKLNNKDFYQECLNILNDRKIKLEKYLANRLINSCANSLMTFIKYLEIIELYNDNITEEVLDAMIVDVSLDNIYTLINALTSKNVSLSFTLLKKFFNQDENINGLVASLAREIRFLYEINYYNEMHLSMNEILDRTNNTKSFRIQKALENLRKLTANEILNLLNKMSDLDYLLKSNYDLDPKLQFELFVLNLLGDGHA